MAAALRLQFGGWVSKLWERKVGEPGAFMMKFCGSRKRKLELGKSEKYKRQRLMKKLQRTKGTRIRRKPFTTRYQ